MYDYLLTRDTPTVWNKDPWGKEGMEIISFDNSYNQLYDE